MTKLAVFSFGNHEIRTATDEHGEAWFVANDICAALELTNPHKALADHVDREDLTQRDTLTPGGLQKLNHVNESGLYALIFGSRKESAKRFKRWVTSEVLPAIRKNGYYVANENLQQLAAADAVDVVMKVVGSMTQNLRLDTEDCIYAPLRLHRNRRLRSQQFFGNDLSKFLVVFAESYPKPTQVIR